MQLGSSPNGRVATRDRVDRLSLALVLDCRFAERRAPVWLPVIAWIAFPLIEQFSYSSRGLWWVTVRLVGWGYVPPLTFRVATCHRVESISSPRCLWCCRAGCLRPNHPCGYLRSRRTRFLDYRAVSSLPDRPETVWLGEIMSVASIPFRCQWCWPGAFPCLPAAVWLSEIELFAHRLVADGPLAACRSASFSAAPARLPIFA